MLYNVYTQHVHDCTFSEKVSILYTTISESHPKLFSGVFEKITLNDERTSSTRGIVSVHSIQVVNINPIFLCYDNIIRLIKNYTQYTLGGFIKIPLHARLSMLGEEPLLYV